MKPLFYDDWVISLSEKSKPKAAMVEITTRCNFSCTYCFRNTIFAENFGDMSKDVYERVLAELKHCDVQKIVFSGWGEPLVHQRFLEFCKLAKDYGFWIMITTNGSLLEKYASSIFDIGIDEIVVSLDAPKREYYELLRPKGKFSGLLRGLIKLRDLKLDKNMEKPEVSIHFTITKYNCKEIPLLPSFARKLAISKITLSHVIPISKTVEERISCLSSEDSKRKLRTYIEKAALEASKYEISLSVPRDGVTGRRVCPFINKKAVFISWDGEVSPCIYYAHNWKATFFGREREVYRVTFGNVLEESLLSIWRKPEFVGFRFKTQFFDQPSCLDCELKDVCLLTATNKMDCWGNTPTCASCPYAHDIVRCPL